SLRFKQISSPEKPSHVCFRGQSGHTVLHCTCLLLISNYFADATTLSWMSIPSSSRQTHSSAIFTVANAEHCKRRPSDYLAFCYRMAAKSARPVPAPVHYPMR